MIRFSALVLVVALVLAGCSKPSANEYFSKAEQQYKAATDAADTLHNREAAGKLFEPALENYGKVVSEYPNDPLAERSLLMVATIRNNEMRDPERAIVSYKLYADRYPDSKEAPVATFLVGYLYHNNLQQFDSASAWYKRFLDRYPQHDMAASAQFELNSLGKSPDELLAADSLAAAQKGSVAPGKKVSKGSAHQHPL